MHEKKPEVISALFGSRTFYIGIHVLCVGVILVCDCEIKDSIASEDYTFPFVYASLMLVSALLFWKSGENPGYAAFVED